LTSSAPKGVHSRVIEISSDIDWLSSLESEGVAFQITVIIDLFIIVGSPSLFEEVN
jgi:hypothetical protein